MSNAKNIRFSLEVFPPKSLERINDLCEVVKLYEPYQPLFVSVTEKTGNPNNVVLMQALKQHCVSPLTAHLIAWDKTPEDLEKLANQYWEMGVRRLLVLRGDSVAGEKPKYFRYAAQMVKMLRQYDDFDISVAAYPEKHPDATSLERDIAHLKEKQEAGADRAITQFFFDPEVFLRFRDLAVRRGVTMPIIPGIMPILKFENICRMAKLCEANVPDFIHKMFENESQERLNQSLLSMNILTHQITRLVYEGVETFHFYTMNETLLVRQLIKWIKVAF